MCYLGTIRFYVIGLQNDTKRLGTLAVTYQVPCADRDLADGCSKGFIEITCG